MIMFSSIRYSLLLLVFVFAGSFSQAQLIDLDVYDVTGDSLFNIRDANSETVVLVFDQFDCPYVEVYKERLVKLQKEYAGKVLFVYVNSDQQSLRSSQFKKIVKIRIGDLPPNTPYLLDKYANLYYSTGVMKSPEVCVIHKGVLVYRGGIDDNPLSEEDVRNSFLKSILADIQKGKTVVKTLKKTAGCMISRN